MIAVQGMDNDELICEFAHPSLTSIIHDQVSELSSKPREGVSPRKLRRTPQG